LYLKPKYSTVPPVLEGKTFLHWNGLEDDAELEEASPHRKEGSVVPTELLAESR